MQNVRAFKTQIFQNKVYVEQKKQNFNFFIIIEVLLFLSVVLLSAFFYGYFSLTLKIILSALLVSDSIAVIIFTIKTYNRNSFDDKFDGVRLEIFIFTLISLFVSVAIFFW